MSITDQISGKVFIQIIGCILGAILYKMIISIALSASWIGIESSDKYYYRNDYYSSITDYKFQEKSHMIKINNITIETKDSKECILKDISIDIKKGEFISIIGPNGSGKTTLLKAIKGSLKIKKVRS